MSTPVQIKEKCEACNSDLQILDNDLCCEIALKKAKIIYCNPAVLPEANEMA